MDEAALVEQETQSSDTSMEKLKSIECKVISPDQAVYSLQMSHNCSGLDCRNQMCSILGIVEREYFGVQFLDKSSGCKIWVNNRLKLKKQVKHKPPYRLYFAVKYFTDPELLLQPATIEVFFKDLRFQIKNGELKVPDRKKQGIGAQIAQAEMGDIQASSPTSTPIVYPPYFPNWNDGIAYLIAKEHKKLKGMNKKDAQTLFIMEMYQLENYGMMHVQALMDGQHVTVGVGARQLHIRDNRKVRILKIPYYSLTQVAFGSSFFSITYHGRSQDHTAVEKKHRIYVQNHRVARSIFRTMTEQQVFFYQTTVHPNVAQHINRRHKRLKRFCEMAFKKKFEIKYYYDIECTKAEAYRRAWQELHQVGEVTGDPEVLHTAALYTYLNRMNTEEEIDSTELSSSDEKAEVCWGLSTSSSKLAKELLPQSQLRLTEAETNITISAEPLASTSENTTAKQSVSQETLEKVQQVEALSEPHGKKLRQLLLKIQDEKLCNVCMDELISSVFCPCGHYVACYRCAKRLDKCPVCRQPVGHVQYVYIKF